MRCPKCDAEMMAVTYRNIQVDRCPECQGLWLDKTELEAVIEGKLARVLDVGAFSPGTAERDAMPATCHRCDKAMTALTGAAEVRFEWCDGCEGMFFDRGELSIIDQFEAE